MPRARSRSVSSASVGVGLQLADQLPRLGGVLLGERLRQPQLHLERDQVLLRAVVEVALLPPSLFVLRRYQPQPRRAEHFQPLQQLCGQADVLEHETGLVCQVGEKARSAD
jgi:hypothetical protein